MSGEKPEEAPVPMRKISQESIEDDIEEKLHEIKKTIGETVGFDVGIFELSTVGVVLASKSSLKAIRVAFSLAVFHHIDVVVFSKAPKKLEEEVVANANKLGIHYEIKTVDKIEGVDLLIVSSKREIPEKITIPILQVI